MKPTHGRTILAGIAGGMTMNMVMLLTFRLIGFGWNGGGILLEHPGQSSKLIAVWTQLEPIPLVVNAPVPIILGIILFGVIHAYIFRWIGPVLVKGILRQGLQFGGLVFIMTFSFWEFFTPFNLFGEPLHLIALELVFWACIALSEGVVIALIIGKKAADNDTRQSN